MQRIESVKFVINEESQKLENKRLQILQEENNKLESTHSIMQDIQLQNLKKKELNKLRMSDW